MTTGAVALVVTIVFFLGWHGARFHRALKDLAGAKAGVDKAKQILGIERTPFLIIGVIAFFVAWWWIRKHAG
jgi:hypothetical protein